ncbi:MAG: hypothetical protein ABDH37_05560 [Candidatus Hydrothermales bacterium]
MKNLKKILKKIYFLTFKIRPKRSYISFPLKIEVYDKLIIIHDKSNEEIEKFLYKIGLKNYILFREEKENEDFFIENLTKNSLIIYLSNSSKTIFLKYLSKDFPVIGARGDLKVVIPGRDYKSFFENFKKILSYN